ncbi:uncharacterized protein BJ171DRAFT_596152 [Polychytrium aggregatum]|uniref:uncharacterized protein n=1 Tax=Polychytrium aggregatum TaxID=110093 RepID=UPI0022FEC337|nr:uncharacterized protein BJ171DRAFT_596152 [Polychytrium aggregatum]KAI9208375.1 hypothetical protein BJ171DRAFT_596152 [Polychytrium aggregatum]
MRSLLIFSVLGAVQTAYGLGFDLSHINLGGFKIMAADSSTPSATSSAAATVSTGQPVLQIPPPMPATWPSVDQSKFITGDLLKDPLVQEALAYVESVVPASLLNLPVSTYIKDSTVQYKSDPTAYCYWPYNLCVRSAPGNGYEADVYTCPQPGTWGLAFDDGPTIDPVSHNDSIAIHTQLDAMHVKGTFFIVGSNAIQNPQIILDEYNDGQQIGVHTWTHHPLTACTNEQIVAEIKYTEAIIYNATGQVPNFFRPPYGDIDDRVRAVLNALGYTITIWIEDDTAADQSSTSAALATKLINQATSTWFPNSSVSFVSLSHDIDPFTSGVVLGILEYVQQHRSEIKLNIEPVGTCVNKPWYRSGISGLQNATTTTASVSASRTGTSTLTSTNAASPTTAGSNLMSGALATSVYATLPLLASATLILALGLAM